MTPYLLERVNQLSGGLSLKANIALIENNARIGAEIAVEYQKLINESKLTNQLIKTSNNTIDSKRINTCNNKSYNSYESSKPMTESMPESGQQKDGLKERLNYNQSDESSPVCYLHSVIRCIDSQTDSLFYS